MEIQDAGRALTREIEKFSELVKEDVHRLDVGADAFLRVLQSHFLQVLKSSKSSDMPQAEETYRVIAELCDRLRNVYVAFFLSELSALRGRKELLENMTGFSTSAGTRYSRLPKKKS